MNKISVEVMDQGMEIFSPNDKQVKKLFIPSNNPTLKLVYLRENESIALYSQNSLIITKPKITTHGIQTAAGFLAGMNSNKYDIIHGCGLAYQNKGIVIAGHSGSGKTTIAGFFEENASNEDNVRILDDDLLAVDGTYMETIGRFGARTSFEDGIKKRIMNKTKTAKQAINLVFLLDPSMRGGEYKYHDGSMPREYTVPDNLNANLQKEYIKGAPIKVQAQVYIIGTDDGKEKTLDTILKLL